MKRSVDRLFPLASVRGLFDGGKLKKIRARKGEDPRDPRLLEMRLLNGLASRPNGGCWEWQRTKNRDGYGTLRVGGRLCSAHRLAFEILGGGAMPPGTQIRHTCPNPGCINPAHLRAVERSKDPRLKHLFDRGDKDK